MNADIFQQAIQTIAARRIHAQAENERRHDEVAMRIPEIAEINHQLAQTSGKILDALNSGENMMQRMEYLRQQNLEAQALSVQLLEMHGYPKDYLNIQYSCEKCQDTGYYQGQYCECLNKLIASIGISRMNENAQIALTNFDSFSLEYYRGRTTENGEDCYRVMQQTLQSCIRYAEEFSPHQSPSLLFYGRSGLGKTHLSLSIVTEVLKKGYDVVYDSIINILQQVEREHFSKEKQEINTLHLLMRVDLLVLDDLGTEYDSPFYVATIYNLINTRLNRGLPTIINTNLDHVGIRRRYEERIVSRLFAVYECMHFVGKDIRLLKKQSSEPRI